jgi:AcrR family transcriptional regulator
MPSRLTREARREHFLEVTAELILEGGIDAVTMESAAARAGVSKGLGYAYFPNRTELIRALFDREMHLLDHRVRAEMAEAETLEDKIRATLGAWFGILTERGRLIGVLLQGKLSDGPLEEHRQARAVANQEFWARIMEAELGLPPKAALHAATMVLAASNGAFDLWITRRGSRRELEATYVTLVMAGLRGLAAEHGED